MEPDVKIEIGESLIHSWLRHVQGCTVTQASWKPSPTWTMARERELKETFGVIRKFASDTIGVQIFKNGDFNSFFVVRKSTSWEFAGAVPWRRRA
jgi:hypothetical protein